MPSYQVKQSSTAYPLVFLMIDSADHVSGKTGLSPTVTISKAGAAFAAPAGAVSEIGSGWYKVAGNATDTATLGPLALHATATGADATDGLFEVVAVDPQAASFGLSLAKTTNITGFNDVAATDIVSAGAITTSGGAVSTVTTVGTVNALAADSVSASALAASAVTELQAGLSTLDAAGVRTALGLASANVDTQLAAIAAKTTLIPASPAAVGSAMVLSTAGYEAAADALLGRNIAGGSNTGRVVKEALYFLRNKWSISGSTLTVFATDDTTPAWTSTLTTSSSVDPVTSSDPA